MATAIEVEVRGENGSQLFFKPIGKSLRGYVDFAQAKSKSTRDLREPWPEPVPGKIIGISETGEKYVREPLYDREHAKVRQRVTNRGFVLPDERETFESESLITWVYWLRRAVDAGLARVVKGELPSLDELEPPRKRVASDDKPRKNFIISPPAESPTNRLAAAIEQLATATAANTAILAKLAEKLK